LGRGPFAPERGLEQRGIVRELADRGDVADLGLKGEDLQRVDMNVVVEEELEVVRVVAPARVDREAAPRDIVGVQRAADTSEKAAGLAKHRRPKTGVESRIVDAADEVGDFLCFAHRAAISPAASLTGVATGGEDRRERR